MKYYLSQDLKVSKFYIALYGKAEKPFVIEFAKRFEADQILKKLNAGILKSPLTDKSFKLDRIEEDVVLKGQVEIYHYQK